MFYFLTNAQKSDLKLQYYIKQTLNNKYSSVRQYNIHILTDIFVIMYVTIYNVPKLMKFIYKLRAIISTFAYSIYVKLRFVMCAYRCSINVFINMNLQKRKRTVC